MNLSSRFTSYRPFGVAIGFGGTVAFFSYAIGMPLQTTWADSPSPDQVVFFESKVRPILVDNCVSCHGKSSQSGGLRLDTRQGMRKGGGSGAAVVPGDLSKSLLLTAVHQAGGLKMPPGKKLKASEIADLEAWVKMGAPWPSALKGEAEAKLWSLQPVRKPVMPKVSNPAWVKSPLDVFVLAKLEASKQKPSNAADNRTLLRRVTFDLTGLPPTAEEMEAFLSDKSPNAYEKVVDRLLASPRYGERWARHWLDVARYADTKGYVFEEDRNYYNAYTYRDWVINALNRDLPYDRFITQQLAADCLPEVQAGDDKTPLAALGFLTVGRRFLNSQPDIIDDRIDVTMRGLQAFTVACARCHDHKFDPIPTQDYYSLYGVFASSNELQSPISDKPIRDPWIQHNQKVIETEAGLRKLILDQILLLRQKVKSPTEAKSVPSDVQQVLQGLREGQLPDDQKVEKLITAFEPTAKETLSKDQNRLTDLKKNTPPLPEFAMAMQDAPNPHDGVVFKRGNPGNPGGVAPRRFLLALSAKGERPLWKVGSGRLELAKAIASPENPLTARVFVNRVWQYHFGAGLVRTPSDFGFQGEKPTHPELLNYLAYSFMENGWSIKKLHKQILMSATYQQASDVSEKAFNTDPENRLWGRMNRQRLELEEMRDAFVMVAGKLNTKSTGGKSVDLWSRPYTDRRAVYGFIDRQNLPGVFRTFDFASPDSTSPRRFLTTVPQQALFVMNSPFSIEQARAVTLRDEVVKARDDTDRIRRLYRVLFARQPSAEELTVGLNYLKPGSLKEVENPTDRWQYGFGEFDTMRRAVVAFTPLKVFVDKSYRIGNVFPDPSFGYVTLTASGGHPGRDGAHSVIRRWIAPESGQLNIRSVFRHLNKQGDGVRARVVSSRQGLLGEWTARDQKIDANLDSISVGKGDTIDFVVDPIGSDAFDSFAWSPRLERTDGKQTWDAGVDFGNVSEPKLTRLALYAQALMMTNEFMFVD